MADRYDLLGRKHAQAIIDKIPQVDRDMVYTILRCEHVQEDVEAMLEGSDYYGDEYLESLTDEQFKDFVKKIAERYAFDAKYACNYGYWDNLESLIDEQLKLAKERGIEMRIAGSYIPRGDVMEFKGNIVDVCEDYAERKGLTAFARSCTDRQMAIEDALDAGYDGEEEAVAEEGIALIYGDDYDAIADIIEPLFYPEDYNDMDGDYAGIVPDLTVEDLEEIATECVDAFAGIVSRGGQVLREDQAHELKDEIKQTFAAWEMPIRNDN